MSAKIHSSRFRAIFVFPNQFLMSTNLMTPISFNFYNARGHKAFCSIPLPPSSSVSEDSFGRLDRGLRTLLNDRNMVSCRNHLDVIFWWLLSGLSVGSCRDRENAMS